MKRETLKELGDFVGTLAVAALIAFLTWAYCVITPDHLSGEADLTVQACEDAGVEYAPAYSGKGVR